MTPEIENVLVAGLLAGFGYLVLARIADRIRAPKAASLAESAEHLARRRSR